MVDTKKALEMRNEGMTLKQIGNYFGVSRERIRQKIGPTTSLRDEFLSKKIVELRSLGKGTVNISKTLGVGYERMAKAKGWIKNLKSAPEGQKRCAECKKNLNRDLFYKGKYTNRCISCCKLRMKKYFRENRERINRLQRQVYKTKGKARIAVNVAVKKGLIKRGDCVLKGKFCSAGTVEAHHYMGYDKENYLNVQWVCRKHHREIDGLVFGSKNLDKNTEI